MIDLKNKKSFIGIFPFKHFEDAFISLPTFAYLVLVIFVRSNPHWHEDLSQEDQGDTRQSTGQSILQTVEDDGEDSYDDDDWNNFDKSNDDEDNNNDNDNNNNNNNNDDDDDDDNDNDNVDDDCDDTCKTLQSLQVGQDERTEN